MMTRYILVVFYHALRGNNWFDANGWLGGSLDHCKWEFVDCRKIGQGNNIVDASFRAVTGIKINKNNLRGSLPNELVHLSKLGMYR